MSMWSRLFGGRGSGAAKAKVSGNPGNTVFYVRSWTSDRRYKGDDKPHEYDYEICSLDLESKASTVLVGPQPADAENRTVALSDLAISPDRQRLAFSVRSSGYSGHAIGYIALLQLSNNRLTDLREFTPGVRKEEPGSPRGDLEFIFWAPEFSPDGKYLAFNATFSYTKMGSFNNPRLSLMKLVPTPTLNVEIQKPFDHLGCYYPRWRKGSQQLVHLANFAYEDALEVCIADVGSTPSQVINTRRLTDKADILWRRPGAFKLSSDQKFVYFAWGHLYHDHSQLCQLDLDAGGSIRPLGVEFESEGIDRIELSATEDRAFILAGDGIHACDLRTGSDSLLFPTPDGAIKDFCMSPDRTRMLIVELQDAAVVLSVANADGGQRDVVLSIPKGTNDSFVREVLWA